MVPTGVVSERATIIALTANATVEDRDKCLACGMDDYCVKPITRDHLSVVMLEWLSKMGVV